jgi:hypothetical protein
MWFQYKSFGTGVTPRRRPKQQGASPAPPPAVKRSAGIGCQDARFPFDDLVGLAVGAFLLFFFWTLLPETFGPFDCDSPWFP